jgi:P27 family predicted phage terminase small subunit
MPRKNPAVAQTRSAKLTTSAGDIAAPVVECPPELGPVARQEWDRIVPQLIAANRITGLDRGVLAAYCVAYAAWLDAVATLQNFGAIMKSPNGHPIQSPAVSIANQQADLMLRIAIQYGFTPASRLRFPKSSTEKSWSDDLMSLEEIGAGLKALEL